VLCLNGFVEPVGLERREAVAGVWVENGELVSGDCCCVENGDDEEGGALAKGFVPVDAAIGDCCVVV
jgi:hypothetical protein